jgi:negative regulator of sigma E activity
MNGSDGRTTQFEQRVRALLEESVARVDHRVRARLRAARRAAVEEAARAPRAPWWRALTLLPTAGAVAAALLVALVLWPQRMDQSLPLNGGGTAVLEDLDLLVEAESEELELIEGWDRGFYEWAVAQAESGRCTSG